MRNNRHLNKSSVVDNHKSPLSVTLSPASTMGTRQRRNLNSSGLMATQQRQDGTPERRRVNNTSVIGGTGPLLSSPFMPQIKRALGLEPNLQHKYGEQRRHSYSLNISSPTVTSPSLPHVKLNRTRRLSLTERNTSMMNRSSTVKIAPPVMGKVASPSLYHLRCNTATMENRGTPDTYAVISALKDRRKRSVNVMEETMDSSTQQAKRRRQESQHSNASTSSMPSMPDHFPELTGADFSMRLETPGIKRPSRPSQADDEDWQHSEETKRQKCLNKNNSILSSLSSSQRFIQNQKRRADSSFTEKENTSGYETKLPRGEPPRLTHLDVSYDTPSRTISVPVSTACTEAVVSESLPSVSKVTEGQTHKSQDSNISVPAVTKLPSMKKTASIYSGLGSPASFKKVQYANVVATLDDYDSDREVEQQRVKQMLKDLDESFNTKQAKTEETKKTETVLTTSTMVTSVTTSVTIATTAALSTTSTTSVLSALEKLSKSPVQETGAPGVMSILGAASTQPSVTVKPGLGHSGGALLAGTFGASGAGSILSTVSSTQPVASAAVPSGVVVSGTSGAVLSGVVGSGTSAVGGFTFNTSKQAQSLSGLLASTTSSSVTVSSSGMSGPSGAGQNIGAGGFNFGSVASTPATSTTAATGFAAPVVSSSTAAPVGGFNFATTGAAVSSSTGAPGFSFGASSTPLTSQGVLFGAAVSTTPSSSGFNVPTSTPAPTGSSTGGFSFGLSAGASTVSSQPAPQTSSLSGFSFGAGTNTGIGANASSGMNPPPYTMNTAASTASQITSATGSTAAPFNFGSQSSSAAASTFSFGAGATSTASTAAGAGLFQIGTVSTTTFGAKTTEQSSMFGAPAFGSSNTSAAVSANPTSAFGLANQTPAFGSANQTPAFGVSNTSAAVSANPTPTFGAANQPPAFGAANQTPAFGSTNQAQPFGTTNPEPTFGSANPRPAFGSANQTPAFGSTNQASAFGAANPTAAFGSANQAPAFGTTNPAPAFGSASQPPAFGSVNQPPAFGTANPAQGFGSANPTPAFGSANPTPAFGSTNQGPAFGSTNQTPAFGSANQAPAFGSTNQAPSFGSTGQAFGAAISQKSNTPVFGSTSNSSSGSTFGAPTGFAKSQSMPVFATTNNDNSNNASTFNFGAPAPNVNPFGQGQKTPAKQTGSAFGQITTDGTPKAQTGALYQFGQSNNNSTVAKGFDFSSSTGGAAGNTGGYNFNTPTATPNFGTPGATPGFSVGAGETAQRATRPRVRGRRTARK